MANPPKGELIFVEKLLREGNLNEALKLARDLEDVQNLDINDKMRAKILQLEILNLLNDHERVMKLADIVINLCDQLDLPFNKLDALIFKTKSLLSMKNFKERDEYIKKIERIIAKLEETNDNRLIERKIQYQIIKGEIALEIFEFDDALESLNSALQLNEKINNMYQNSLIIKNIADVYFYYGHLDIAKQNYATSLEISLELGYKRIESSIYHMLAGLKFKEDKLKEALEYELKSGKIYTTLNDEYALAYNQQYLGFLYRGLGELDKAIECLQSAREFFKKNGHTAREINVLINIIGFYRSQGEYDKALKSLDIYYQLNTEMNDEHCLGIAHHWYGAIFAEKGELDLALEHYEKALTILQNFKSLDVLGDLYGSLGELYHKKGDMDKTLEYHLLALEYKEKMQMGAKLSKIAYSLKCLILIHLVLDEQEIAENYLERLEILSLETDNIEIEGLHQLSKAIVLKYKGEPELITKSEQILLSLVDQTNMPHNVRIEAILNLCELLLDELGKTEDLNILEQTNNYILELIEIATVQNLYPLLSQSYLLRAQLSLIEIKIEEAKYFIGKSQQIAQERGLDRLAVKISNEYDRILETLDKWNEFTMKLPTIAEKLELTHIEQMLNQMIRKRSIDFEDIGKEEEFPIMFFIINDENTILFSENFDEELEDSELDQLQEILRSINRSEPDELIQRDRYQDFTYLSKKIGSFLFCYIMIGKAYIAINKMNNFFKEIQAPSPIWDILEGSEVTGQPISVLNRMALSQTITQTILTKK